jgi:ComF family protein
VGRSHITLGRSIGEYEGSLRGILHALKYDRRTSIAAGLHALMRVHGRDAIAGADYAVPVPLHWRRRWSRGFNQAAALAGGLGLPVMHALRRTRPTRSQTDLPADRRRANVRNAFAMRQAIGGAVVVLVDDVSTTGATLEACATVLIEAGAAEVRTLTAARVVTRPPGVLPR